MTTTPKNSKLIIATMMIAFFAVGTSVQSAEALANHATHTMVSTGPGGPYPDMWGIKATYKAEDISISSGTLTVPTWATLDTGIYREVGWKDTASNDFEACWAVDGDIEYETASVSDGVSYNWEVSNVNETWTWSGAGPGFSKAETNFAYEEAVDIQLGFEYSTTSISLPTVKFESQKVHVNGGWENWNDQNNGRIGENDPSDAYVLECGNDYTTEHGEGSQPGSC